MKNLKFASALFLTVGLFLLSTITHAQNRGGNYSNDNNRNSYHQNQRDDRGDQYENSHQHRYNNHGDRNHRNDCRENDRSRRSRNNYYQRYSRRYDCCHCRGCYNYRRYRRTPQVHHYTPRCPNVYVRY